MISLLPPNATAQERALSLALARISDVPVPVRSLWNPQTCPAAVLPWLAWAMSVDDWDGTWTEQQKRDVIQASVEVHRQKGTIGSLKAALRPLGFEVDVKEQASGPYTFRLNVDFAEAPLSNVTLDQARSIALRVKNVRSWLVGVNAMRKANVGLFFGCCALLGDYASIYPYTVANRDSENGFIRWAIALFAYETATVNPPAPASRLTESGSYRLTESGFKRLLE